MTCWRQTASHYPRQYWLRPMSKFVVSRLPCINLISVTHLTRCIHIRWNVIWYLPHYILSYHAISYPITSYDIMACHIIGYYHLCSFRNLTSIKLYHNPVPRSVLPWIHTPSHLYRRNNKEPWWSPHAASSSSEQASPSQVPGDLDSRRRWSGTPNASRWPQDHL